MDFRLCTLCIVAIGLFLMVDQLKAEEQTSEATETEPQEATHIDSNHEVKKRSKIKKNSKLERNYHQDGKNKRDVKQFEDINAFNKNKNKRSLKREKKHIFEKNKVDEEVYSNGYVDSWNTPNDERNVKQEKNTKGRKHKFSYDQTVDPTQRNERLLKKEGRKRSIKESAEYETLEKVIKKYDCTGGKKHKKGRCTLADEMQICDSCGSNVKHSKYMKKKIKSENSPQNLDEWPVQDNSDSCRTAETTENKLRGRNGNKLKQSYVVEDEYEAGTNEGDSVETDEDENLILYNSDENDPSQFKGKIRRYIIEEEFIEDSIIDQ